MDAGGSLPMPGAPPQVKLDSGDTAWMLAASALVLLMTLPGCAAQAARIARRVTADTAGRAAPG